MKELDIRYALFDMDGTLADTMGYWRDLAPEALAKRGVTLAKEHVHALESLPFTQGLAYLQEKKIPRIEEITRKEILSILEGHYRHDAHLKKGAREFLEALKARGARMGVATLTPKAQAKVCLESLGIDSYFEFLLTGEDYPHGKSDPEIFFGAAERFGCAVHEMHLFEDSLYSIKTAHAAGIPVVGIADVWQADAKDEILSLATAYFEDGFTKRIL